MSPISIVEYFSEHSGYRCGYCKSPDGNYSRGMWAHELTPLDYQNLIDRGWRRSGRYCYKPSMAVACCPQYTIRCEALDFQPTKSQKKVLKRVHKFLAYGKPKHDSVHQEEKTEEIDFAGYGIADHPDSAILRKIATKCEIDLQNKRLERVSVVGDIPKPSERRVSPKGTEDDAMASKPKSKNNETSKPVSAISGIGADLNKPPCKKAKLIRKERRLKKLVEKAKAEGKEYANIEELLHKNQKRPTVKSLEDFLNEPLPENPAHKLEIHLVRSSDGNKEFRKTFSTSYSIYKKYQMTVHKDPADKCPENQFSRFLVKSPLKIRIAKMNSSTVKFEKDFDTTYAVYKSYQMEIHKEEESECGKGTFIDFLISSPLIQEGAGGASGPFPGFGSFHQQYWLDDHLIAVGVIDILPYCVSSVYLYYDPEFSFLSLGTYAALREIAFTRQLHHYIKQLKYYYMGFYIHSCPKMRYKGQFYPSYLLCPETYGWFPIERCKPKLDISKYSRFEEDTMKEDEDGIINLHEVQILHSRQRMPYAVYLLIKRDNSEDAEVAEYAKLVGKKCYSSMLLYRA